MTAKDLLLNLLEDSKKLVEELNKSRQMARAKPVFDAKARVAKQIELIEAILRDKDIS